MQASAATQQRSDLNTTLPLQHTASTADMASTISNLVTQNLPSQTNRSPSWLRRSATASYVNIHSKHRTLPTRHAQPPKNNCTVLNMHTQLVCTTARLVVFPNENTAK